MYKLILLRHGESVWNSENRFTGWMDVDLSPKGEKEAEMAGTLLKRYNILYDLCYTSFLKRAIKTQFIVAEKVDRLWIPVVKSWRLNERHYGALQGLNKKETALEYGDEHTVARVLPYWQVEIAPQIAERKTVLIAAHGNSLRALIMHLEELSPEKIIGVEIPTGTPLIYELDKQLKPVTHYYLE